MVERPRRLIVGMSGSSGAIYGVRLLEVLADVDDLEVHAIISKGAKATIGYETSHSVEEVMGLVDVVHDAGDIGASIASGTFLTDGMIIAPCSMKTLSSVANSFGDNLISRAADVSLKERRRLVLVTRETPLHLGHLRLMSQVTESGGIILPPVPGFYVKPKSIADIVDHTVTKILDLFDIDTELVDRWEGLRERPGGDDLGGPTPSQ